MNKREKLGYSDPRIMYGLAFYEDLQGRPLKQKDVDIYVDYIKAVLQELDKGLSLELVGGFRRGKPDGHDIDLMITHKQEGSEAGVLDKIVGIFHQNNLVMLSHIKKKGVQDLSKAEPYDSFEKLYGIYKLPNKGTTVENIEATDIDNGLGQLVRIILNVLTKFKNTPPCYSYRNGYSRPSSRSRFETQLEGFPHGHRRRPPKSTPVCSCWMDWKQLVQQRTPRLCQ